MKKTSLIIATLVISTMGFSKGEEIERLDKETVKSMTDTQMAARLEVLELRLEEINTIDFSSLERSEKKELKSELRYINREMNALGNGGIYISTGAIIIILLLILIL